MVLVILMVIEQHSLRASHVTDDCHMVQGTLGQTLMTAKKIMASFPEIYLSERKRVKMERNGKRNGSQAVTEAA